MSFTAALLILAQSTAPQAANASPPTSSSTSNPSSRGVSVQVQASATILRPARVTFENAGASSLKVTGSRAAQVQRSRDSNGTLWAEFS